METFLQILFVMFLLMLMACVYRSTLKIMELKTCPLITWLDVTVNQNIVMYINQE